jgi:hypothetical protein
MEMVLEAVFIPKFEVLSQERALLLYVLEDLSQDTNMDGHCPTVGSEKPGNQDLAVSLRPREL